MLAASDRASPLGDSSARTRPQPGTIASQARIANRRAAAGDGRAAGPFWSAVTCHRFHLSLLFVHSKNEAMESTPTNQSGDKSPHSKRGNRACSSLLHGRRDVLFGQRRVKEFHFIENPVAGVGDLGRTVPGIEADGGRPTTRREPLLLTA